MPLLLILLLIGVFLYLWIDRRGSTLTRACRWRLDRTQGEGAYRCASCGATTLSSDPSGPRQCLRPAPALPPR